MCNDPSNDPIFDLVFYDTDDCSDCGNQFFVGDIHQIPQWLEIDYPDLHPLGWNDRINSVIIPLGLMVKFYEADGFVENEFLMASDTVIPVCQKIREESRNKISSVQVLNNAPRAGKNCGENIWALDWESYTHECL